MELKVSVKDGKTCEKILKIEVAQGDVEREFDHFYEEVAPKAKVPGFRPGKAPRNVLELHYKNDAREHVVKHLISESYRQALKDKSQEIAEWIDRHAHDRLSVEKDISLFDRNQNSAKISPSLEKLATKKLDDLIVQAQEPLFKLKTIIPLDTTASLKLSKEPIPAQTSICLFFKKSV